MNERKTNLKSLSEEEIFDFVAINGLQPYRARQLIHWIYRKFAESIEDITEFSKVLREKLCKIAYISNLKIINVLKSKDLAEKFLFMLEDNNLIESILIPEDKRLTLCVSSQVGCSMRCSFCQTGKGGFIRNLKAYEIVDQIITVDRFIKQRNITNVVFMGMGEPLLNFTELVEAVRRIKEYIGISKRRITVSTCGIVPSILKMAEKLADVNLAVSINAASDDLRSELMPINKKYPLKLLLSACKEYSKKTGNKITFEYVLIKDKNDSEKDALSLYNLIRGIRCKVNLIPFNEQLNIEYKRPEMDKILEFQNILNKRGIRTLIRESRGLDIQAACGQLRLCHL
jgi:23S rRNA (adenine2503-C2)-methyltransferase